MAKVNGDININGTGARQEVTSDARQEAEILKAKANLEAEQIFMEGAAKQIAKIK